MNPFDIKPDQGIIMGIINSSIVTERDALQQKLRVKINSLREKRNVSSLNQVNSTVSNPPKKIQKRDAKKSDKAKKNPKI